MVPSVPVPPTALEVKRIFERSGRPLGIRFPYRSFGVRVRVMEFPEVTRLADVVTVLLDGE